MLIAAVLAIGLGGYLLFARGRSPRSDHAQLRSPFDGGLSIFVKVDPLARHWAALAESAPELSAQILAATGLSPDFFRPLAGVGDFELYIDLPEILAHVRVEDLVAFSNVELPSRNGPVPVIGVQSAGEAFVGTSQALERLPAPHGRRAISDADMATIASDAFVGMVWHERDARVMSLSVTPAGTCLRARGMPVTPDMKADLQREAASNALQVVFDEAPSGEPRLCFRGEPFASAGLAMAIVVPAMLARQRRE
jgi:hypothetical protein